MTKFNKERCDKIIDSISHRVPYIIAAEANGICEETLYDWLRTGLQDIQAGLDTEHARFSESLKKVEEKRVREHLSNINENPERWQAQAWLLERRWWQHFSPVAANIEMNKKIERMALSNVSNKDISNAKEELDQISDKTSGRIA